MKAPRSPGLRWAVNVYLVLNFAWVLACMAKPSLKAGSIYALIASTVVGCCLAVLLWREYQRVKREYHP